MILSSKYPNTLWGLSGEDYSGLEWNDDSPKPTEEELLALWPEVKNEFLISQVKIKRLIDYRNNADPLFFQWQAGEVSKQDWLDARNQVVTDNPYPTNV